MHPDETYRKVAWRLIPVLMLCYFSAYIDRANIGIAKLVFMRDLGFTEAMYGLGGGLFYLGYCLLEVPSNLILRRVGARRTFIRILLLWSLCTALMALVTRDEHFYALRFLLGAAEKSSIASDLAADARFESAANGSSLWAIVRQRQFYALAAMSAALISGIGGVALWMPTILRDAGIKDAATVATLTAIPYLLALIVQQWMARRSDRLQERRWHAAIPVLIAAAAWLMTPQASVLLLTGTASRSSTTSASFGHLTRSHSSTSRSKPHVPPV